MRLRDHLVLFMFGLLVAVIAAAFQTVPGYMDAEYYYSGGLQLAAGKGFQDPFIWNYLDDPTGIPHPSHTYWMPLASIVAAGGMLLTGLYNFLGARVFFVLIAAFIPALTAGLSFQVLGDRKKALLAGWLAVFPGFYTIYLANTESFSVYMLFGALFMLLAVSAERSLGMLDRRLLSLGFGLGVAAGFMHLSRADGMLWLGAAVAAVCLLWLRRLKTVRGGSTGKSGFWLAAFLGMVLLGYTLLTAAWYARNIQVYGSLFSPAGGRTLWLTEYNQIYSYPADRITLQSWLNVGTLQHLRDRANALTINLVNVAVVQGLVFLLPMMIIGAWQQRKSIVSQTAMGMLLVTLAVMSIVFPYSGSRGGFIHSGAAVQPFLWAVAPGGLDWIVSVAARWRNWQAEQAKRFFRGGVILLCALLSLFIYSTRVVGGNPSTPIWQSGWTQHIQVGRALPEFGVQPDDLIMVNNPPGLFAATGRSSVVIPDEDVSALLAAARRYGVRYLVLDPNHGAGLAHIYSNPRDLPGLRYLGSIADSHIFRFEFIPDN
ncbi:MAG: hypothetical protein U1B80_08875 [Anaerolineaceae bacterium]|nr:hypothetical protein [Anaerolineaceae bacterium]